VTSNACNKPHSAAIICLMPDYGHAQPVLKVADALSEAGFEIKFYLADELAPLLSRFSCESMLLENTLVGEQKNVLAKFFARNMFFTTACIALHYLICYPPVAAVAALAASRLRRKIGEQRPDVIVCDGFWFEECYERIAAFSDAPVVFVDPHGSLSYRQSIRYGLSDSDLVVRAVEVAGAMSRIVCTQYYRLRYFRTWREARAKKRAVNAAFAAAFAGAPRGSAAPERIVIGTAAIERERLGVVIRQREAQRREFLPFKFRRSLSIPDELRKWIERDVEQPIVYVSFGSIVEIDSEFATSVYEGLRNVRARVLWSLRTHQHALISSSVPADNVRLEAFLPQEEILESARVRCFVTQAGASSVAEGALSGTPMLCIPFFSDQADTSLAVARLGIGKRLWRRDVSPTTIAAAVAELLATPRYMKTALEIRDDVLRRHGGSAVARFVTELVHSSEKTRRMGQVQLGMSKTTPLPGQGNRLSIVIACHNGSDRLEPTLKHLAQQSGISAHEWEIVLVDNASTDSTAKCARDVWESAGAPTELRIVSEPRLGSSNARRTGILSAKYEIVCFVDDDNWVCSTWCQTILNLMNSQRDIGVITCRSIPVFERGVSVPGWFAAVQHGYAVGPRGEKTGWVDTPLPRFPTSGLSFRREAACTLLERGFATLMTGAVGRTLGRGEDAELCYGLGMLGCRFWYEESLCFAHFLPRSRLTVEYALGLYRSLGVVSATEDFYHEYVPNALVGVRGYLKRVGVFRYANVLQKILRCQLRAMRSGPLSTARTRAQIDASFFKGRLDGMRTQRKNSKLIFAHIDSWAAKLDPRRPHTE
jgi:UDP:flavonoid glycosyltransferase YjiC (YdhE family)/glycosyltransferase involved in cell wall biosynthesis